MKLTPDRLVTALLGAALVGVLLAPAAAVSQEIPRMPDGKPDLSGTYDIATLTPLSRPQKFGDKQFLTQEEADEIANYWETQLAKDYEPSDPNRPAPEVGGTETLAPEFAGAAGGTGGYNAFYVDIGESNFKLDGQYRTSIIVDPSNGQMPPMVPEAMKKMGEQRKFMRPNTGEAWWIDMEVGPYDDPELRPLGERCLLGFGSTAGPPALPVMYNNMKRIVQTEDHFVILNEMNHDARIVRIGGEPAPAEITGWLGDSVGHWEGDTLVVETRNFRPDQMGFYMGSDEFKVTERFSRIDKDTLLYNFTVEDPKTWTAPWTGEYPWPASENKVYEYACHEGNYALGGILRGARLLEEEALAAKAKGGDSDD